MQLRGISFFSRVFLVVATSSASIAFGGPIAASIPFQTIAVSAAVAASGAALANTSDDPFAEIASLVKQKQYPEAAAQLRSLIEGGSVVAATTYGRLLLQGMEGNEPAQLAKGITYLEQGADQDSEGALQLLAKVYLSGHGSIRKNIPKALTALTALADLGGLQAQVFLAEKWQDGTFGSINGALSLHYMEMAAKQGHTQAYYPLLEAYSIGTLSTSPNSKKAAIWGNKIAETGGAENLARVGNYFIKHHDDTENTRQGLQYLEQAAEENYQPAYTALAGLYWNGARGIDPDPVTALRWIDRSAKAGNADASKFLIHHHTKENNHSDARRYGDLMTKDARGAMDFNWLINYFINQQANQNIEYFIKRASRFDDPQGLLYLSTSLLQRLPRMGPPMKKLVVEAQMRFMAPNMQCTNGARTNICHKFQDIKMRADFKAWEERDQKIEQEKTRVATAQRQTRDIAAARKEIAAYRGNYLRLCPAAPALPGLTASENALKRFDREGDAWSQCVEQAVRGTYELQEAENTAVKYGNETAYHPYIPVSQQIGARDATLGNEAVNSFFRARDDRNARVDRANTSERRYAARKRQSAENGAQLRRRNNERNQSYRRLQRSLKDLGRQACETSNAGWRNKGSAYWGMMQNCSR